MWGSKNLSKARSIHAYPCTDDRLLVKQAENLAMPRSIMRQCRFQAWLPPSAKVLINFQIEEMSYTAMEVEHQRH